MATPATQPVPALRIRQSNSLDFSNVVTTSPLRAVAIFLGVIFIRFRGPQALKDSLLGSRSRHCYAITDGGIDSPVILIFRSLFKKKMALSRILMLR
jgi:hypothetical protein